MTEQSLIQRFDVALWRLPVWARKLVIAPAAVVVGVAAGIEEGWPEVRYCWRTCMEHVEAGRQQEDADNA